MAWSTTSARSAAVSRLDARGSWPTSSRAARRRLRRGGEGGVVEPVGRRLPARPEGEVEHVAPHGDAWPRRPRRRAAGRRATGAVGGRAVAGAVTGPASSVAPACPGAVRRSRCHLDGDRGAARGATAPPAGDWTTTAPGGPVARRARRCASHDGSRRACRIVGGLRPPCMPDARPAPRSIGPSAPAAVAARSAGRRRWWSWWSAAVERESAGRPGEGRAHEALPDLGRVAAAGDPDRRARRHHRRSARAREADPHRGGQLGRVAGRTRRRASPAAVPVLPAAGRSSWAAVPVPRSMTCSRMRGHGVGDVGVEDPLLAVLVLVAGPCRRPG